MPKLGYKPKAHDHAAPVAAESERKEVFPELTVSGKNIQLAKLENLANVGTEITATVTLVLEEAKIQDDVDWEDADTWDNRLTFKVKELYVDDLTGAEPQKTDQEKYEEGLIGTAVSKNKKTISKQEAIGDY